MPGGSTTYVIATTIETALILCNFSRYSGGCVASSRLANPFNTMRIYYLKNPLTIFVIVCHKDKQKNKQITNLTQC